VITLRTGLEIDQREGEHTPLFCLHGIGGNTQSFQPQLQYFEGTRNIIAWNMPGYGGSAALPEMTFQSLADAAVAALDELKIEQAVFVGQSIGGMVALEMAPHLLLVGETRLSKKSFSRRDSLHWMPVKLCKLWRLHLYRR